MASIFGFELKGVKTVRGLDFDAAQGSIYYNGKKVGFYREDGNGGPTDINFYEAGDKQEEVKKALQAAVKDYFARYPQKGPYAMDEDAEAFFIELLNLMDVEKAYKKYQKKWPYICGVSYYDEKAKKHMTTFSRGDLVIREALQQRSEGLVSNVKEFRCLNDFCIAA